MKWLAAGLTCVNFATVSALILGMMSGGLNKSVAVVSICLGIAAALLACFSIRDPKEENKKAESKNRPNAKYRNFWLWLMGGCFALFAFRSFCWLLYVDGDQLKIQSPNNLGDIALHITYIKEFANGVALWPDNPIFVFSKLRYPAGTDLFNAILICLGVDLIRGLVWVGLLGSLATFWALRCWGGTFGVAGFLFNGGVVGFHILQTSQWLDYQGVSWIAWKSISLSMFVTQRGFLYAIPAGLLLLYQWRAKFFQGVVAGLGDPGNPKDRGRRPRLQLLPFWIELTLYASMPLFHVHTFLALSIALAYWFVIGDAATRKQLLLLVGGALIPATFFVWLITDNFRARSLIEWHPGWARSNPDFAMPFLNFWWVNFGIFLPLVILAITLCVRRAWKKHGRLFVRDPAVAFLLPATVIFLFACFFKTAAWEWDNTKIIIWAYLMVLPFLWQNLIAPWPEPVRVAICVALFGSGFVSLIGGLAAGTTPAYEFANRAEFDAVGVALRKIPVEARFAAYPTYNHPLLLNGRKVALGYDGHLWTQGFNYTRPRAQLTSLMLGAPNWRETARELGLKYLFWGREEMMNYATSTRPWEQLAQPVIAGSWGAIYDLEQIASAGAAR